jgi:ferritin-like metal-binding protein YciE
VGERGCADFAEETGRTKAGLPDHLRETENHFKRLEQVLQLAGLKAKGIDGPKGSQ